MKYFYHMLLTLCFSTTLPLLAQDAKQQIGQADALNFYPNPVSNGKIYLIAKSTVAKEITIYDVLGKKVFQTTLNGKELNISNLLAGVYIIKIREEEITATRKLIVK